MLNRRQEKENINCPESHWHNKAHLCPRYSRPYGSGYNVRPEELFPLDWSVISNYQIKKKNSDIFRLSKKVKYVYISTAFMYFYVMECTRWGAWDLGSRSTYLLPELVDISFAGLLPCHTLSEIIKTGTVTAYLPKQLSWGLHERIVKKNFRNTKDFTNVLFW